MNQRKFDLINFCLFSTWFLENQIWGIDWFCRESIWESYKYFVNAYSFSYRYHPLLTQWARMTLNHVCMVNYIHGTKNFFSYPKKDITTSMHTQPFCCALKYFEIKQINTPYRIRQTKFHIKSMRLTLILLVVTWPIIILALLIRKLERKLLEVLRE